MVDFCYGVQIKSCNTQTGFIEVIETSGHARDICAELSS